MLGKRKNDVSAIDIYEGSQVAAFQRLVGLVKTEQIEVSMPPDECIACLSEPDFTSIAHVQTQSTYPFKFKASIVTKHGRSKARDIVVGDVVQSEATKNKSVVTLRAYYLQAYVSLVIYQLFFASLLSGSIIYIIADLLKTAQGDWLTSVTCLLVVIVSLGMIIANWIFFPIERDNALQSVKHHLLRVKMPPELVGNAAQRRTARREAARALSMLRQKIKS